MRHKSASPRRDGSSSRSERIPGFESSLILLAMALSIWSTTAAGAQSAGKSFENWYPSSIALPPGYKYPCALTPLPRSMRGIPESDRQYINHVYSMILRCCQAKVVMMKELGRPSRARAAYSKYYYAVQEPLTKIRDEPTPKGLGTFRNQVVKAIMLQVRFFDKASRASQKGGKWGQLMAIPEGKQASTLLRAAWGLMAARYPSWDRATRESIYHHLCALDLF